MMVPPHAPLWLDIAVAALSIGISCAWYCAMALLASHPSVRRTLVRRKAVLDTAAGVLLVGVGGRMLAGVERLSAREVMRLCVIRRSRTAGRRRRESRVP
ncbi:putative nicotinamide N-methyase [Paraburkholderia sp. WSM4179]|nr:putative nicotinamide N-methyase [Paraburkholderia sp. WSM4179]